MYFFEPTHTYYSNFNNFLRKENENFISGSRIGEIFGNEFDNDYWSKYKAYEKLLCDFNMIPDVKTLRKEYVRNLRRRYKINYTDREAVLNLLFDKCIHDCGFTEDKLKEETELIKRKWSEENSNSCDIGSKYHLEKENDSFKKGYCINPFINKKFKTIKTKEEVKEYKGLYKTILNLHNLKTGFYPEIIVNHNNFIGTIDKLWIYNNGNQRYMWISDYKTNKKLVFINKFQRMKYPLKHLYDCNYTHYTLQLSFYAYILSQYDYQIKGMMLEHYSFDDNRLTIHKFNYLDKEIKKIIPLLNDKLNNLK